MVVRLDWRGLCKTLVELDIKWNSQPRFEHKVFLNSDLTLSPTWSGDFNLAWFQQPGFHIGNIRNSNFSNCTVSSHFSSSSPSTTTTSRQYGKRYNPRPLRRFSTPLINYRWTVHGSLARAGKVKSQTPKVDKQEKKKTPKGRAKKRILYNRRCVLELLRPGILI